MSIKINIANKHCTVEGSPVIVCGNSDYQITFAFDEEWDPAAKKTARFSYVRDGKRKKQEVEFSGNTVAVPPVYKTRELQVGVYVGDLVTSTPARIPCEKSAVCDTCEPDELDPSQYKKLHDELHDELSTYVDKAVKDEAYELIDTITFEEDAVLNLTQEPDGSPIKFSRVMLLCDTTNKPELSVSFRFPGTSGLASVINWGASTSKQACYSEGWVQNGYWRFEWAYNTNFFVAGSINRVGYNRITEYEANNAKRYISGMISNGAFPAGTVLKIYAIRYKGE